MYIKPYSQSFNIWFNNTTLLLCQVKVHSTVCSKCYKAPQALRSYGEQAELLIIVYTAFVKLS